LLQSTNYLSGSVWHFSVGLLLILMVASCAHTQKMGTGSAEERYTYGMQLFNKKNYLVALDTFEDLRANFPFSKYAIEAELKIADCYFFQEKYIEAVAYYKEFIKLHPSNENLPHVWYHLGLCHYNESISLSLVAQLRHFFNPDSRSMPIDRDVSDIQKAYKIFRQVVERFPDTEFAIKAKLKQTICEENLFAHDLYVGRYYLTLKDYYSAYLRFEKIINAYPQNTQLDEITFLKGQTLLKLNEKQAAFLTFKQFIADYPDSSYYSNAQEQILLLKEENNG